MPDPIDPLSDGFVRVPEKEFKQLLEQYQQVNNHIQNRFKIEKMDPWLKALGPVFAAIVFGFTFYHNTDKRQDRVESQLQLIPAQIEALKSVQEKEMLAVKELTVRNLNSIEGLKTEVGRSCSDIAILRDRQDRAKP